MTAAPVSTRAIARDEMAAVYSQTVPEHGGGGKRARPVRETEWERRRLLDAARTLRGGA